MRGPLRVACCLLAFAFLFSSALCAQEAGAPAPEGDTPTAVNAQGIVVWRLTANEGVNETDVNLMSSYVTSHVAKYTEGGVISEEDILTILQGEVTRQQCGVEDNTCLVEIGAALGVPEAVSGGIGRLGAIWMLNLRRINVRTAEVISRSSRQLEGDIEVMIDAIPGAVAELFGVSPIGEPGTLAVTSQPEKARVWIDGELVGATPLRHKLAAGSHRLRLTLDGYFDEVRDVEVVGGERRDLTVQLRAVPANPYKVGGHATFWTGLGLAAAGGVLNWQAAVRQDDWKATGRAADRTASRAFMGSAVGAYSLGGALMVTGIILWALDPGDEEWTKRQMEKPATEPAVEPAGQASPPENGESPEDAEDTETTEPQQPPAEETETPADATPSGSPVSFDLQSNGQGGLWLVFSGTF